MKTKLHLSAALFFAIATITTINAQSVQPCGTTEVTNQIRQAHPELVQAEKDYNDAISKEIENKKSLKSPTSTEPVRIIPIVFHILHVYGTENISDAQVFAQVDRLNKDYRKLNADTASIVHGFDSIAADCRIEFRLAQKDPNGNCTNGIDRIYTHKTMNGENSSKVGQWPREKYLNVWVVKNIPSGGSGGTVLGFALFPSDVAGALYSYDGIMMLATECNGTSRTLTHEVGHWINLQHTWGSTNQPNVACGDDLVNDTPITKGHFSTCPLNDQTCTPGVYENVQNYMDYSSCVMMFTEGQKARMRTALESNVSNRNHLWINSNLIETGVIGGTACVPHPEFYTVGNKTTICAGGNITFTKNIMNAPPTGTVTTTWIFQGGTPGTSTAASPVVTYNTPGIYDVTLIASNSVGADTVIKQGYITVSNPWGDYMGNGYVENFEDASSFWYNWRINNLDNNFNTFTHVNYTGYNSSKSVMMNSFQNYADDVDELISPSFNLAFVTPATLSFKYAGASHGTTAAEIKDILKVSFSTNCGSTWTLLGGGTINNAALANNGYSAGFFTPTNASQWVNKTLTLPAAANNQNVRFKFEYTSGPEPNNLYIDDININGVVGITENANSFDLLLSPNPANQATVVSYHLTEKANVTLQIVDVLGKVVAIPVTTSQNEGDYRVTVSKGELNLSNGIYFIKLTVGNSSVTRKLIFTE
jgi:PKD repeat protein